MSHSTPTAAQPPTSSARLVMTLGVAGLLSGLVLVLAYRATLPTIEANEARALRAAVLEVVPGSSRLTPLVEDPSGKLVPDEEGSGSSAVYAALDSTGALRGYAIPAEGAGFQDNIRLIYGFDPSTRHVVGMRVLDSRETPGLGDKIYKDASFVHAFDALAVDPEIRLVKSGDHAADNEVHAITGATISSRAVVRIVNESNARWLVRIPEVPVESSDDVAPTVALPVTERVP